MKKIAIITLMLFLSIEINAQINCVNDVKTTTPTINLWNWTGQYWELKYRNAITQTTHLKNIHQITIK